MPAIISAIITTIIAFSSLILLDGDVGDFFGEVALIVILTYLRSLVEALIILPAHLSKSKALQLAKKNKNPDNFNFFEFIEIIQGYRIMNWLRDKVYSPTLKFALKNRFASLSGFVAALVNCKFRVRWNYSC